MTPDGLDALLKGILLDTVLAGESALDALKAAHEVGLAEGYRIGVNDGRRSMREDVLEMAAQFGAAYPDNIRAIPIEPKEES